MRADNERLSELCTKAANEDDPEKLSKIASQIGTVIEQKRLRLKLSRIPMPEARCDRVT